MRLSPSRLSSRSSFRLGIVPSRLVSFRLRPVVSSRGAERSCGASSSSRLTYTVLAHASSRLARLVLRCVERGVFCRLAALSCVLFRSAVLMCHRFHPSRLSSRLAMRRNGTTCVSIPCRRVSCAVSLSYSLRSSVRLRLVPPPLVRLRLVFVRRRGHGRLVAWSMWGN